MGGRKMFNMLWSAAIVICTALCLGSLLFASVYKGKDSVGTGAARETLSVTEESTQSAAGTVTAGTVTSSPPQSITRLTETPDAGQEYLDEIIFLGDSTTYGIKFYLDHGFPDLVSADQIWTPSNGTFTLAYQSTTEIYYPDTGEEMNLAQAVRQKLPKYMIITLGVNGIAFMDESYFTEEYDNLVERIQLASPDTIIICNSIFPVAENYENLEQINNTKIQAANKWIESIAENRGTYYLYSYEALADSQGNLPLDYQNGDGLHLTGEAFEIFLSYVRTHACPEALE